ncbi:MAG: SDR family oxidoreductase [Oceanospirillaceae bacterium]|nr:SDR family oxidoreductase [Oceanospirillaceae bacterium]
MKNILITGVSRGLGLQIAKELLETGNCVYGVSRSSTPELEQLLADYPSQMRWISYDLSDSKSIRKVIFKDWLSFDTVLHGFVNNAAFAYDDIITNANVDQLSKMFDVNVISPMIMVKYTIRQMLLHRVKGSIVHLSSISAHTGYKGLSMYAATKGALEAYSKNTAREWGEIGVRSNCLVAGFMETEMSSTLSDSQKNRIFNRTSMKKPVSIESVASTICFLLSDGASSITGQLIHVDNGTI